MHSAQLDLNNKLAVQQAADAKHAADLAAVESAKSQLATFQASVDKLAAAQYMGGRTDGLDAILTATSPQGLIDQLAVQRVMATEMSAQMKSFATSATGRCAPRQASAKSAADAKTAAEQAAAVRAELQSKQSKLQLQIAVVKSQYDGADAEPAGGAGGHATGARLRPRAPAPGGGHATGASGCGPGAGPLPRGDPHPPRRRCHSARRTRRPVGTPRPSFRPR